MLVFEQGVLPLRELLGTSLLAQLAQLVDVALEVRQRELVEEVLRVLTDARLRNRCTRIHELPMCLLSADRVIENTGLY